MQSRFNPAPLFLAVMGALAVMPAHADTATSTTVDTGAVSIMGEGQVRASNAVDRAQFQEQAPGKNPVMAALTAAVGLVGAAIAWISTRP